MNELVFQNTSAAWLFGAIFLLGLLLYLKLRTRKRLNALFKAANAPLMRRRLASYFFYLLGLSLLVIALMRPQQGYEIQETSSRGSDIFIVVDVSDSMRAQDIKPSRLERVKRELIDLMSYLKGDRVGLIAFSGRAYVLCPLTNDYETMALFVNDLDTSLVSLPGTNIQGALKLALESFGEGNPDHRAIILLTDGEITEGDSRDILSEAEKSQTRLYIMGIGTTEGAPIPQVEGGDFIRDSASQIVLSKLNEDSLKKLALSSRGVYVRSVSSDEDLKALYLDGIRQSVSQEDIKGHQQRIPHEKYAVPLMAGLIFLFLYWFL